MSLLADNVLSWTCEDPRQSKLFASRGLVYRFSTEVSARGPVTNLYRVIRVGKEDRVARLEWGPNNTLGQAIIGKSAIPMTDLVRPDPRNMQTRTFRGPDGNTYRWRPSGNSADIMLQDPYNNVIAIVRPVRPTRYSMGDVYAELHFVSNAGAGAFLGPTLMDTVTVSAMLYRFCSAFGL